VTASEKNIIKSSVSLFDTPQFRWPYTGLARAIKLLRGTFMAELVLTWLVDLIVTGKGLLQLDLPKREAIISPFMRVKSLSMVFAARGVGKTWFVLQLALSVARGEDFFAWAVPCARRVLLIDGEMPLADLQERLHILTGGNVPDNLYILPSESTYEAGCPLNLADPKHQEYIEVLLGFFESIGKKIDLIIFDNLSSLVMGIDESSNNDQEKMIPWLIKLRHRGYSALIVHHSGKDPKNSRGASRREDHLDTVIALGEVNNGQLTSFSISFTKTRGIKPDPEKLTVCLDTKDGFANWTYGQNSKEVTAYKYLIVIYENGFDKQKQLAEYFNVSAPAVSQQISKLRQEELIEPDSLMLTEKGIEKVKSLS